VGPSLSLSLAKLELQPDVGMGCHFAILDHCVDRAEPAVIIVRTGDKKSLFSSPGVTSQRFGF